MPVLAYIGMVVSGWCGLLVAASVDPNNTASWVGGAAALTLLTIAIGFNAGTLVRLRREVKETKEEQRHDQRVCNWQLSVLAEVLDANAIPMPPRFWDIPDDEVLKVHEQERKRGRPRMFQTDPDSDERGGVTMAVLGGVLGVVALFAAFALILNLLVIQPLHDLQNDSARTKCVNSLTADYFVSLNVEIQAPPNSPLRDELVKLANEAAERIRHRAAICSDGEPDYFQLPELVR